MLNIDKNRKIKLFESTIIKNIYTYLFVLFWIINLRLVWNQYWVSAKPPKARYLYSA